MYVTTSSHACSTLLSKNITFTSRVPHQIIVQWNRLLLLEGPDLPSILHSVSVTKEKLSTQCMKVISSSHKHNYIKFISYMVVGS
jgi:hypothetical protein